MNRIFFAALGLTALLAVGCNKGKGPEEGASAANGRYKVEMKDGIERVFLDGQVINCPVAKEAAARDVFYDHDGKRYFFCCGGCIGNFSADPASFISKGAVGVPLDLLDAKDKAMKSNVDKPMPDAAATSAAAEPAAEPAADSAIASAMHDSHPAGHACNHGAGGHLEYGGKKIVCPMTGEAATKGVFADLDGKRYYFCCPHCKGSFDEDPSKFLTKEGVFGVPLTDLEQIKTVDPKKPA